MRLVRYYESYDLVLSAGDHVLVARVWRLGELGPQAQVSTAPSFLLVADPPHAAMLSTGSAGWEVRSLARYTFALPRIAGPAPWFTGAN